MKAKEMLESAKAEGINLKFDVDLDNSIPFSYKDIVFNRNELSYVQQEVKDLEKKYYSEKQKKALDNLDIYKEHIKKYNDTLGIVMIVNNKEINILKTICDNLVNIMEHGVVFLANKTNDGVNFICRSNCSINAGLIMKYASTIANGNGGGSNSFAQGGSKDISNLEEVIKKVEDKLNEQI